MRGRECIRTKRRRTEEGIITRERGNENKGRRD